ncbi:hypothetical protein GCM10011490_09040 [Pseudoclavibacter endophyticus]|uniref:NifU family protein n=1 Tax=Pseudoclavibacter endophyticus TaxID=1778590 RepID=A0A6H9WTA7_9MICO|nr:hypothetical protein [Pseudoclavibacter endophyticus]KAB1649634.1 hypothetical protein F8O04_05160 [Pseudoclavibacter endophyticus]GGA61044.1 hypothetical protein GCM10011490_09040 [Pseudoclavibacter endophyticus]
MAPSIDELRTMLETDGFGLEINEQPDRTHVEVVMTSPDACADCIVPESIMRMYLEPALGVQGDALTISYPPESASPTSTSSTAGADTTP